jgi:4'-phosphopantetheinyl transferase
VKPRSPFPRTPTLSEDEVHVILVDLAEVQLAALASILDADEQRRAASFRRAEDRDRYIASHVAFREVVGAVLHKPPADVRWSTGRNDKPLVAGSTLGVNLSHSGQRAAVALAWGRDVGVDIEQVCEVDELELAASAFSPVEQRELLSYHEGRREAFHRIWVGKEALVKARGDGLGGPLTSFDVSAEPGGEEALIANRLDDGRIWSIQRVDAGRDYAAAIAASSPPWRTVVWAGIERPRLHR